ncbi:hypothetical protein AUP74_02516 [Microbulbifer aggregans]|uniref:DUF547 domain-containing protein n=1 Tax=Microbulbifer aggregans TaxID=1769779 RepID=A0A1C9W9Z9_9GAMM|nr:DUF547 domain-containing protein [Microbulbifer aggregans]AOS97913.1 hypothetical protein AUP74_02516 [Microbulbifer aggregans]
MWRLLVLLFCFFPLTAVGARFDHRDWSELLARHVDVREGGKVSLVDYRGMATNRAQLEHYLDALARVPQAEYARWAENEQLAFLINLYNAATIELILQRYPELDSIRDLGSWFRSPWKRDFIALFGRQYSLDDIEHGMIRADFTDPRIHFAVNCASIGCPMLRESAYTGSELNEQLEEQTQRFLGDRSRNRASENALELSAIFKWYRDDFARGWRGHHSLSEFLYDYRQALGLSSRQARALQENKLAIRFLDYDWRLNDVAGAPH